MRTAALALAVSLAAGPLFAQAAGAGVRRPREEAYKMVEAYFVSNLQESLALTDDQFAKLLPLVKRLQRDRRDLNQRRGKAMGEMRRLLGSGLATEPRLVELLKEVKAVEREQADTVRTDMEAIDGALTPTQQAKYRLFEVEVERKIRALLSDVRPGRQGLRGGRAVEPEPEP